MSVQSVQARFARHAAKGVILDSNLLVVYLVGLHDQKAIERFIPGVKLPGKAVYFPEDFDIIKSLLLKYRVTKFIVTPNILTEVSNLTFDHFPDKELKIYIRRALAFFKLAEEKVEMKDDLLKTYHLPTLGFSDASIIETAKKEQCLVLTEDLKCMAFLEKENCCVYNINHLRTLRL